MVFINFDTDLIDYPKSVLRKIGKFPGKSRIFSEISRKIRNFLGNFREFSQKCFWNFLELLEFTDENWNLRLLELYWNWNFQHSMTLGSKNYISPPKGHKTFLNEPSLNRCNIWCDIRTKTQTWEILNNFLNGLKDLKIFEYSNTIVEPQNNNLNATQSSQTVHEHFHTTPTRLGSTN